MRRREKMARIKHIAIATPTPEETAKFYRDVFELKMVGKVDSDDAEGYYLSDGNINIAILRFKNEAVAGSEFGTEYAGIHHIGFQVEDTAAADARLRGADSHPRDDINAALNHNHDKGHGGRNVEMKYSGPDGVIIDISQNGWVGTGEA
jgi:catechol 2,3-dioxygenase-like lactoylglutathione lyase family enzyme